MKHYFWRYFIFLQVFVVASGCAVWQSGKKQEKAGNGRSRGGEGYLVRLQLIKIFSVDESPGSGSFCEKYPCRAKGIVNSILQPGSSRVVNLSSGDSIALDFSYALKRKGEDPGFLEEAKPGSKFRATIHPRMVLGKDKFRWYVYRFRKEN